MLENLNRYHIHLASKSPRRRELLSQLRLNFNIITIGGIKEEYPDSLPACEVPQFLSNLKADAYLSHLKKEDMIITADTVVILDNHIYGKPKDAEDAKRMLKELSGRTHKVVSGVTVLTADKRVSFSDTTEVKFAEISEEDINYYVDSFNPTDKAGAYGIQEWIGCVAVAGINGSFYNVMGLPVHRLYNVLKDF